MRLSMATRPQPPPPLLEEPLEASGKLSVAVLLHEARCQDQAVSIVPGDGLCSHEQEAGHHSLYSPRHHQPTTCHAVEDNRWSCGDDLHLDHRW